MNSAFVISFAFHILIIIIAWLGLPFIAKDPDVLIMPVSVELVKITEEQQASAKPPKPSKQKPIEQPKKPKPPKPVESPKPDPIPLPEPEPEKPKAKPKPKPKKPKPPEKAEPTRSFQDLLKDITPVEDKDNSKAVPDEPEDTSEIPDFAKELAQSELENLQAGISPCWNVDGGGRFAEELVVDLYVTIYPDMRVKTVQVRDQIRYAADPAFRAAADAASRALRNPNCSTLNLPPEKFGDQSFEFTFDPRGMLGY